MNQRKTDFLDYLKHLSTTTLVHQQNFINKWYDLFSMLDENQYNSIPMDDLTDAEYYVMNYSIPHVGSYKVYFNIDHVIQSDAYQTSSIQAMTEEELDRNRINHPIPFDMNIYLLNQFQCEYSANGRPLVTVEKSTQYAKQVHLTKKLNTVGSPF